MKYKILLLLVSIKGIVAMSDETTSPRRKISRSLLQSLSKITSSLKRSSSGTTESDQEATGHEEPTAPRRANQNTSREVRIPDRQLIYSAPTSARRRSDANTDSSTPQVAFRREDIRRKSSIISRNETEEGPVFTTYEDVSKLLKEAKERGYKDAPPAPPRRALSQSSVMPARERPNSYSEPDAISRRRSSSSLIDDGLRQRLCESITAEFSSDELKELVKGAIIEKNYPKLRQLAEDYPEEKNRILRFTHEYLHSMLEAATEELHEVKRDFGLINAALNNNYNETVSDVKKV